MLEHRIIFEKDTNQKTRKYSFNNAFKDHKVQTTGTKDVKDRQEWMNGQVPRQTWLWKPWLLTGTRSKNQ